MLRVLLDVARHGSFSAVARERQVDPSVISRTVASLEERLGIRLFQRSTRRVIPTEAARALLDSVSMPLEEIDRATQAASEATSAPRGVLRVTASVSFGQRCIVPALPAFFDAHSDVSVELMLTDAVVDLLAERIDVAIRLGSPRDSSLVAKRLMRTHYVVCASPEYLRRHGRPNSPDDLSAHNCLLFALPGFRKQWKFKSKTGKLSDVPVIGRFTTSNALALQSCACAGAGIALLPNWLAASEVNAGQLINLFPHHSVTGSNFETGVWFMYPSRHHVPAKVRAFTRFLQSSLDA
jgi:DNA-binding transcriptional LysR family regulator